MKQVKGDRAPNRNYRKVKCTRREKKGVWSEKEGKGERIKRQSTFCKQVSIVTSA